MGRPSSSGEMIDSGDVAAGDLRFLFVRNPLKNLVENLPALRPGRLLVRVIRAPHQIIHTDDGAIPDAQRVLLKAAEDVLVEEVAGQHIALKSVPVGPTSPLRIGVVDAI